MVWYSHLFKNFPQFVVIHTVRGFGIVYKAEVDVFLELSCFFDDSMARRTSLKKKSMRYSYAGKLPKSNVTRGRRQWHPTSVLLPGKPHGRRSLVGCSPWGREESDMSE